MTPRRGIAAPFADEILNGRSAESRARGREKAGVSRLSNSVTSRSNSPILLALAARRRGGAVGLNTGHAAQFPPVARAAKGAHLSAVLSLLDEVLARGVREFICVTILWMRCVPGASDRLVNREQGRAVHRLRRILARRGVPKAFIIATLESTPKHGTHAHIMAECPARHQADVLDAMEDGLNRRYGWLPPRTFIRDGWHRGRIRSANAARGKAKYLLKSLPLQAVEQGVRRGEGLRPVNAISVRCSRGRGRE